VEVFPQIVGKERFVWGREERKGELATGGGANCKGIAEFCRMDAWRPSGKGVFARLWAREDGKKRCKGFESTKESRWKDAAVVCSKLGPCKSV